MIWSISLYAIGEEDEEKSKVDAEEVEECEVVNGCLKENMCSTKRTSLEMKSC